MQSKASSLQYAKPHTTAGEFSRTAMTACRDAGPEREPRARLATGKQASHGKASAKAASRRAAMPAITDCIDWEQPQHSRLFTPQYTMYKAG